DLRFARLAGANLSYADLRNVALDGADLDATILANAIWLDGRTCHPASRGTCLID
ncbi:MAG: pentapeptide repeat-containing protein, partial [Gammaproteobacteria bacterium]|nr:pentapeptide repeat-containing protein [Gammaproteobacteria bacterium]